MKARTRFALFYLFNRMLLPPTIADFPNVPLIDLSAWINKSTKNENSAEQQTIVDEILEACRTVGFFIITNHGVNPTIIQDAWDASASFFELPIDEKIRHKATDNAEYPYGYEQTEQLSKGKALDGGDVTDDGTPLEESKETFAIGPDNIESGMPLRRWFPTPNVPHFESALVSYYEAMEGLALQLLELFALALGQPVDFFEDKMDHHMSALRLIHYYPLVKTMNEPKLIIRAGAHTDYGALTILNAAQPGLQVLRCNTNNRNHTEWYSVPVVPGALVINLGDLMQRWTNGTSIDSFIDICDYLQFQTFLTK